MKFELIKKLIKRKVNQDENKNYLEGSLILEQIDHERSVYLEIYRKELDSLNHRKIQFETEKQVTINNVKHKVFRQMRVDALYNDGDEVRHEEANISNPAKSKPIIEDWDDIKVTLKPIVWNAVEFDVKSSEKPDINQLANWHNKWFDPKNKQKPNEHRLHKVIHKLSEPVINEDGWSVIVDFGSADIDAFLALIKQCRFNWADEITISSEAYFNRLSDAYDLTNSMNKATITTTAQPR